MVVFSPEGFFLATASSDESIIIWNVKDFKENKALKGHASTVNFISFSHDSKLLISASRDGLIKLWNI